MTFLQHFQSQLNTDPAKLAYTFLDKDLNEISKLSYAGLDREAKSISAALQEKYSQGDRIALLFPSGIDFICAFYACIYSGMIAVPIYPPRSSKPEHLKRIKNILLDSGVKGILSIDQYQQRLGKFLSEKDWHQGIQLHLLDRFKLQSECWRMPKLKKDDIVFLQYTSGSTGEPKGVMVTHQSLMHNESIIKKSYRHNADMVLVGWLPFYHDMGLIGNILQPSYCGGHAVLMDPMTFLQKPENWLIAIDRYRAVTSGGPNFSYQLCIDRIDLGELKGLDLSCWLKAFTGAEPIRARTLQQFSDKFEKIGFQKSRFHSGYGLAEATLQVCSTVADNAPLQMRVEREALAQNRVVPANKPSEDAAVYVSSGELTDDMLISIVNPESGNICSNGEVGEIWVSGDSVTKGYWGRPQLTQNVFCASLNDDRKKHFLRTGDLGFTQHGNLFVTGRLKDLIIIRGQNHAPEDIEQTVISSSKQLQADGCAVFSIDSDEEERLVIVQEVKRTELRKVDCASLIEKIKQTVLMQHKLSVDQVVLLKPKTLPKTTSGKIRRHLCKQIYLDNQFVSIDCMVPSKVDSNRSQNGDKQTDHGSEALSKLMVLISEISSVSTVSLSIETEFNSLGLDSLKVVELHYQIETAFQVDLELEVLYSDITLLDLALEIDRLAASNNRETLKFDLLLENSHTDVLQEKNVSIPILENQRGLLYLSQAQADIPIYNIPIAFKINTAINIEHVKSCLIFLINRHCVFRSRFSFGLEKNEQIFDAEIEFQEIDRYFEVVDYRRRPIENLEEIIRLEAQKPFDLESGPLMRAKLYLLPEARSVFMMTNHHIITDLSSLLVLFNEFFRLYSQISCKHEFSLPDMDVDYIRYADWQRSWLQQPQALQARLYWQNELSDELPTLDLPKDRPRAVKRSYRAASYRFSLPEALKQLLLKLTREHNTSLYTVLLSAYQVLLCRLSGQDEVVVGSPTSAHSLPDFSGLVGYCLNPVILRANMSAELKFSDLLRQNRQRVLNALKYRFYPLQKVLDELPGSYPQNVPPYFQTLFYLYKPNSDTDIASFIAGDYSTQTHLHGLDIQPYKFDSVAVEYDLNVWLVDSTSGLLGEIAYNSDLFDQATMQRFVGHYQCLLQSIVTVPDALIQEQKILTQEDYRTIVDQWSVKKKTIYADKSLPRLFEEQAIHTPDRVALQIDNITLSYMELESKSNQLAHYLIKQGVKPGMRIGLCLPRSANLVISILAILKVGAAYVPLDPDYPKERINYIVKDAEIKSVVTEASQLAILPEAMETMINLSNSHHKIIKCPKTSPKLKIDITDLAYIIYTSGSTGNPNGVLITHENVVRLMRSAESIYDFNYTDTWTLFHSYAFDFSVWEIWGALLYGARLIVVPYWLSRDAEAFYQLLCQEGVTVLNQTPSAFRQLLAIDQTFPERKLEKLRYIIFGGEALDFTMLASWYQKYTDAATQLVNMYGITETTVHTSYHLIHPDDCKQAYQSNIGRALPDIDLYILDRFLNPVPIGVCGELYVGGRALARGYWNNKDLTEKRFIVDPFSSDDFNRLYKTGDLARFNCAGQIEYMGRCDHQVKIRGFRIELGEIEARINQHASVQQAIAVVTNDSESGDKQLLAYIKPCAGLNELDIESLPVALKLDLKDQLPSYMVPAHIIVLQDFPLTASGKIDTKSLLEASNPESRHIRKISAETVMPRNEIEALLLDVWKKLFKLDHLGVTENFFELGGDSLMSNRMLILAKESGIRLSLQDIFVNQTIESLAKVAKQDDQSVSENSSDLDNLKKVIADPDNRFQPFPLTDIQQAYWLGRQGEFDLGNIGTHSYAEVSFDSLDVERFEYCWNRLIKRHEMLRMVVNSDGKQSILPSVPEYRIKVYELHGLPKAEAEQQFLAVRDELSHQLFNGSDWPLFDIRVSKISQQQCTLHISMDMLTLDAASALILLKELSDLYADPDLNLPVLALSFRDYVLAEHQIRSTALYQKAKDYWLQRIDSLPMAPDLPIAVDPATISQPVFERRQHALNSLQWQRLKQLCQRHRTTPTIFLLACMSEVLYVWSKQEHFSLNLTLFNRLPMHDQVNDIIGDFTSLTILEVDFRDKQSMSFSKRVERLHAQLWQDLEHKYFSGVEVQRELSRHHGETINIPLVVTSAIGLPGMEEDNSEQGQARKAFFEKFADLSYGITQTSQVWLDIQFSDMADRLTFNWDSVQGLFPEGLLDHMFAAYCKLLGQLADDDYAWSSSVFPLVPDVDLRQIKNSNNNAKKFERDLLHGPLLKRIALQPDHNAVITSCKVLSYQELGVRSERLSFQLKEGGAKPNELIAVLMEKGWQQIVAVLAVLRCGAAYLPIDSGLPEKRIHQLLALGQVKQVISLASVIERLNLDAQYDAYAVDEQDIPKSDGASGGDAYTIDNDHHLAYVIFTSGSTGEPKGVMIDHKAAINTIADINARFNVTENDTVLGLSSLSFDLSVYDIFGVLGAGGTLVLPEPDENRDPEAWLDYIYKYKVSIWNTVPALMGILAEYAESKQAELGLRLVLMSGDWIPVDLPGRIRRLAGKSSFDDLSIISLGGATEASIWSVYYPILNVEPGWSSIPYGQALSNQSMQVLKPDLSPCPVWVAGDLYIGGVGLALGYWQDIEKTQASFIVHPVSKARLYKTGDMARLLPDGQLEFLGRSDFQVKLNGHRVELGEIESRLLEHQQVQEAVVMVYSGNGSGQTLVAYITNAKASKNSEAQEMSARAASEVITDAGDKLQFKFEQRSIRQLHSEFIQLPVGHLDETIHVRMQAGNHGSDRKEAFDSNNLSRLLRIYARKEFNQYPIAKGYYPSSGSLYPIQVYLKINAARVLLENGSYLQGGYYYYHPLKHALILLEPLRANDQPHSKHAIFDLYLVADYQAIEPMYGQLAESFCRLEAGYMACLLQSIDYSDINVKPQLFANQNVDLADCLHLHDRHQILFMGSVDDKKIEAQSIPENLENNNQIVLNEKTATIDTLDKPFELSYQSRKSYRAFTGSSLMREDIAYLLEAVNLSLQKFSQSLQQSQLIDIYLCLRKPVDDGGDGLSSGYYRYRYDSRRLSLLTAAECNALEMFFTGQEQMEEDSGIGIFIVADQTKVDITQAYFQAGYLGQMLNHFALWREIGLCGIGYASKEAVTRAFALSPNQTVLHSIMGGKVSKAQIECLQTESSEIDISQKLKTFLAQYLPEYMLPTVYIPLEKMPLTSNGKIDRKALPKPDLGVRSASQYKPAQTETEKALCEIWRELIPLEKIGIHDNFFELGGNSMDVVTLRRHIQERMHADIPMVKLFSQATVAEMAAYIESGAVNKHESFSVPENLIPQAFGQLLDESEQGQAVEEMRI